MRVRSLNIATLAATLAGSLLGSNAGCQAAAKPSRYLYLWAGSGTSKKNGVDIVAVVDANPKSATYGSVINALTVDTAGRMPHHAEFQLSRKGPLFMNDFAAWRQERAGQLRRTRRVRRQGKLLRYSSSVDPAFPGEKIRTYALTLLPKIDRVVTTSSPMDSETVAKTVQVWRLSDLKLIKTIAVPKVATDSIFWYPFEVRTLADGRTAMMNTYTCGIYTISKLDSDPTLTRVLGLNGLGCSVPVISGHFMLMPIAYGHRYATIDISDPSHPREVSSVSTDSTFYPHWAALDPGSDRVVVDDQGDGAPFVMVGHFSATTGRLTWDERFRDAGASKPGREYSRTGFAWGNRMALISR